MSESCFRMPRHVTIFFYVVFREGLGHWNKTWGVGRGDRMMGGARIHRPKVMKKTKKQNFDFFHQNVTFHLHPTDFQAEYLDHEAFFLKGPCTFV